MGINAISASQTASLLRTAEQDPAIAATLLKKATDADKDLVNTLLPASPPTSGQLNLRA